MKNTKKHNKQSAKRKTLKKSRIRNNKHEKFGRILLIHQLFPRSFIHEPSNMTVVSDHMWLTHNNPFNKLTLLHRFISSNNYAKEHGFHRTWVGKFKKGPFTAACRLLKRRGVTTVNIFDPIDIPLLQSIRKICAHEKLRLIVEETPSFLESTEDLDAFLKRTPPTKRKTPDGKSYVKGYNHDAFYKWNRRRLNILMKPNCIDPVNDKWTYDTDNRQPFPKTLIKDPTIVYDIHKNIQSNDVKRIISYINKYHSKNPGNIDDYDDALSRVTIYPVSREDALKQLKRFMKILLPNFGPYEDAFRHENMSYGYHSVLSSSLNNGLITPRDILQQIRKIPKSTIKKNIASIEGFVRQIFGWRSYCRCIYRKEREYILKSNYLNHTKRLPSSWFTESPPSTNIEWLDTMFKDAYNKGYAHHIVRLMIFSQWFLLNRIQPLDVLRWFWSVVSIDAYEWVMIPNVMCMGQFADGGMMMKRPYISASSYLTRMSGNTLPKNNWINRWDGLYYTFLIDHTNKLNKIYAYSRSYSYIKKSEKTKKQKWKIDSKL